MDKPSNNPPQPMKLSPAMIDALRSIHQGKPWQHLRGMSQHGGATSTARALRRLGLVTGIACDQFTEAGRDQAALLFVD